MATLKIISNRLKSVKNIQKITKSMKMVSAAKYSRAERELREARPYGEGSRTFFEKLDVAKREESRDSNKLIIAMSSDRGLCGAVHGQVSKAIKAELGNAPGNTKILCIGDKSRILLQGLYRLNIVAVATEVGRLPPNFKDASKIALQAMEHDFTVAKIVFNKFKSVVSFGVSEVTMFSEKDVLSAPKSLVYDSLDSDILESYLEYSLASLIFYTLKENACSEQASRMSAMDNASKNAGDMIDMLTLKFNRTRQAVITRELIEIISGASALK